MNQLFIAQGPLEYRQYQKRSAAALKRLSDTPFLILTGLFGRIYAGRIEDDWRDLQES